MSAPFLTRHRTDPQVEERVRGAPVERGALVLGGPVGAGEGVDLGCGAATAPAAALSNDPWSARPPVDAIEPLSVRPDARRR